VAEVCDSLDNDCDGGVDNVGGGLPPEVLVQFGSQMKYNANTTSEMDIELVGFGTPMSYLDNTTDPGIPGVSWTASAFPDGLWPQGYYGVGYETAAPGANALLTTIVPAGTFSVFTRAHFDINDIAGVKRLYLGVDYDDGFVAWINGVEVARSSTMPGGGPAWDANAASHESSNGAVPNFGTLIEISASAIPAMHDGDNVLAIGVWNTNATTSTDLVLVPRLSMTFDWTRESFSDSMWADGYYGVGYDTGSPSAVALFNTPPVPVGTFSGYTRTTFTLSNAAAIERLMLGVDYDDGYVAYINGVEVASAPEVPLGELLFNTSAALHESSNGAVPDYNPMRDISHYGIPALHDGVNVLAIGIWNSGAPTSTDLVLVPRLSIFEGELCDGLDNDCDGSIDEGFPNTDGGATADCVDPDDDNDLVLDEDDCAPTNPLVSEGPMAEVDLTWVRGTVRRHIMTWSDQGSGAVYDIVSGDVSVLIPDGGISGATCAVNNLPQAFFDEQPDPLPGQTRYYLVRAEKDGCIASTYGLDSSDNDRAVPTLDCP